MRMRTSGSPVALLSVTPGVVRVMLGVLRQDTMPRARAQAARPSAAEVRGRARMRVQSFGPRVQNPFMATPGSGQTSIGHKDTSASICDALTAAPTYSYGCSTHDS